MMAEAVAGVNPDVLRWARERSGLTAAEVAKKIHKSAESVEDWETGGSAPTYVQLEKLAYQVYKRPVAVFFFPEPPDEPDRVAEFRTLPAGEREGLSDDTRYAVRLAEAMQSALRELNEGINPSSRKIFRDVRATYDDSPGKLAEEVRSYVGVSIEDQSGWASAERAFEHWRATVEDIGVYVFKRSFKQRDISGFSLVDDEFSVIYVNNGTSFTRQVFTLWHEVGHLLLHTSGVTKTDDSFIDTMTGEAKSIEVMANAFAGEFLVPSDDFERVIESPPYSDEYFASLAGRYHVSREVVLRKHLDRGLVAQWFYEDRAERWNDTYREKGGGSTGGNYFSTQGVYLSQKFLELAFGRYYQDRIDLEQLADFLNVKAGNIPGLEQAFIRKVGAS